MSGYGAASTAGGPPASRRGTARSAASFASRTHSLAPSGKQGQQRQLGGVGGGNMPQGLNALRHMAARQAAGQAASTVTGKGSRQPLFSIAPLALSSFSMFAAQLLPRACRVWEQGLAPRASRHVCCRLPLAANHRRPLLLRTLRGCLLLRTPHRRCLRLRLRPPQPQRRLAQPRCWPRVQGGRGTVHGDRVVEHYWGGGG